MDFHAASNYPTETELLKDTESYPASDNINAMDRFLSQYLHLSARLTPAVQKYALTDRGQDGSAIFWAVKNDHPGLVEYMLKPCALNPNPRDKVGMTPLHHAVSQSLRPNQRKIIRLLLVAPGVKIDAADRNSQTPLHLAAKMGTPNSFSVQLLLLGGASMGALDRDRRTPLQLAVLHGNNSDTLLLLQNRASDYEQNDGGRNLLDLWLRSGVVKGSLVTMLINLLLYGVDINSKDNNGETVLHQARKTYARKMMARDASAAHEEMVMKVLDAEGASE